MGGNGLGGRSLVEHGPAVSELIWAALPSQSFDRLIFVGFRYETRMNGGISQLDRHVLVDSSQTRTALTKKPPTVSIGGFRSADCRSVYSSSSVPLYWSMTLSASMCGTTEYSLSVAENTA